MVNEGPRRKPARFVCWLTTGLRHESMRLAGLRRRTGRELPLLNAPVATDGEQLLDRIPAPADTAASVEDALFAEQVLALLTLQQRLVIRRLILEDCREQDVALELGISQQAVSRLKNRALQRLRREIADYMRE